MRTVSAGCHIEKEDSMLLSDGMSNHETHSVCVGACRDTVLQTVVPQASKEPAKEPAKEYSVVNFSLGMQSKVKMVESVKPVAPPPLISPSHQLNQSESELLMDRVNESQ